ncbi:choice-of-anchor Q domain-containing protein [Variovorax sp. GB1P17]|uniref:choice-of-anchor Q domain-containing protein n=1 Tax=Variovorax sp. GB1P17 TaxID=3443740 RepID=UPI003F47A2C1
MHATASLLIGLGLGLASALPASAAVGIAMTPASATLAANGTQQFQATVSGATDTGVVWMVDGVVGGAPSMGTISTQGLYTAPANAEGAVSATVTAAARADGTALANAAVSVQQFSRNGRVFHVAPNGVDSRANNNYGSAASPWRTIQYAMNQVQAGDTVLVHAGVYNETVKVTRSGSAAAGYITLMAAPSETAVIDGTSLVQQPYGMQGLVTLDNVSYVRLKGFEIRNYRSASEFIVMGVLVMGSGERIEVRNNLIHHIEATNLPANGNANALGLAVYGLSAAPMRRVIVDGNALYNLKTGLGESLTVDGNVDGWQVSNNIVHDNNFIGIDATGYYNTSAQDPEKDRPRNGWIADNTVYNLSTAGNQALTQPAAAIGIYVDGGMDITVERNKVDSTDGGIWLLSEKPGKRTSRVTVRSNLVRFNANAGILVGGYGEQDSGGANDCTIVNNTLYLNNVNKVDGINAAEFQVGHHAENIVFGNNILYAGDKGYAIVKFSPANSSSVTIGYNIYYTTSGGGYTRWFWIDSNYYNDNVSGPSFQQFKAASGDYNDSSVVADPQFENLPLLDFRLKAGSPAVDSGFYAASLGAAAVGPKDFVKNPRRRGSTIDRGAFERQ